MSHASPSHAHTAHHWEISTAPFLAVFGIFFLVPLTFSAYFVYESILLTILFAGIGTPLLIWGVAQWTSEGMSHVNLVPGVAAVGLPLFIVSEVFIFLSLFATYWTMRLMAPAWPPAGSPEMPVGLPLLMTALLVTSSVTIHMAEEKLAHQDMAGFRQWLIITIVLGAVFLGCTTYEYSHLIHTGFVPGTNAFSTSFFTITGFHASHVLLGLLAFVVVLIPALSGKTNKTFVECVSVYWHFVDIVWFFVVSQLYFW